MEYTKEDLIKHAIGRVESMDEVLKEIQLCTTAACAERRVVRSLLYLACEKKEEKILEE